MSRYFWPIFTPLPLSHFVTHPGTPLESTSHISDPPIFSRPSTKIPGRKPPVQILSQLFVGFLFGGFVRGSFIWKVSSRVVFYPFPFVRIHLLRQKVKHHFKCHV